MSVVVVVYRMSIEWFESERSSNNDLPWIKEYVAADGAYDAPIPVEMIYECDNGLLVLTDEYKGFVYNRSTTKAQLLEALEAYMAATVMLPLLVVRANKSGKLEFGLDKERTISVWTRHGRQYSQTYHDAEHMEKFQKRIAANPLIPTSIPSKNGRAQRKASAPPIETSN